MNDQERKKKLNSMLRHANSLRTHVADERESLRWVLDTKPKFKRNDHMFEFAYNLEQAETELVRHLNHVIEQLTGMLEQ